MSEDELRQLWCLLDSKNPKETPFPVDTKPSWNVYQLTQAIQREKGILRDFDTSDITLWKVDELIQVSSPDSFHKHLPISLGDSCLALRNPALKISEIFPGDLVNDPLHIIVSHPDKPPYKKRRVGPAPGDHREKASDRFRRFRNYYWGEDRIKPQTEGGQTYSILDLSPPTADLPELNFRRIKSLIIRDEYKLAHDAIVKAITEMEPESRVVFIFTGQPGTGKTLFLFVLLVLGLQHKQAVALQINPDEFVLFNEDGVSRHGKHDKFAVPKGAWTLSDSHSHGPCTAFLFSKGHLIYTSSPPASGAWGWSERFGAREYVMDVWSLAEFQTLLTVSDFDIPAGETLFLKYGSNIRSIIDILKRPQDEAAYIQDVENEAADIAREFSTILQDLERLNFKSKLSSNILTVRPNNLVQRLGVLTIPTAYLFKTLAKAVSRRAMAQQYLISATLTAHPSLDTVAELSHGFYEISSSSTPVHGPSGSTMGHLKVGSTGASHHQVAQVSTRPKGPSQKQSTTLSAHSTNTTVPRRSPRNRK